MSSEKQTPKFIDPSEIIDKLDMDPGMTVAHFGCGAGFFTFPIAKKVGSSGKVYALDVLDEKVRAVRSQAKTGNFNNIFVSRVNLEEERGSQLGDESVDWVIMVNMLFQNERKSRIIEEAKRILKTGGKILLIDWNANNLAIGPEKKARISKEELTKIVKANDLDIIRDFQADDYHQAFVLIK